MIDMERVMKNEYLVKVEYTGYKIYKIYADSVEEAAQYSDEWLESNANPTDDRLNGSVVSIVRSKVRSDMDVADLMEMRGELDV